jgi:hypothetical protein
MNIATTFGSVLNYPTRTTRWTSPTKARTSQDEKLRDQAPHSAHTRGCDEEEMQYYVNARYVW